MKLLKLLSSEGLSHILAVIVSIQVARVFGVVAKGEIAEFKLYGGLLYLVTFSGFRYLALSTNDKLKEINAIVNGSFTLFLILLFPALFLAFFLNSNIFFILLYSFLFSLVEIYYATSIREGQVFKSFLINLIPNSILILVLQFVNTEFGVLLVVFIPLSVGGVLALKKYFSTPYISFKKIRKSANYNFTAVITSLPGFFPMLLLVGNKYELGLFSLAAGFNIVVLKLTRVMSITAYKDFEIGSRILSSQTLKVVSIIGAATFLFIPLIKEIVVFVYGIDFANSENSIIFLMISAIFLPINSRIEAYFLTFKKLDIYNYLNLFLCLIFISAFFFERSATSVSFMFLAYRFFLTFFGIFLIKKLEWQNQ